MRAEDEDAFNAITRDLRRTTYLAGAAELALEQIRAHVADEQKLLATLHYHLSSAWDDGAGNRADLRSAIDAARQTIERLKVQNEKLKAEVRTLLKRISADR